MKKLIVILSLLVINLELSTMQNNELSIRTIYDTELQHWIYVQTDDKGIVGYVINENKKLVIPYDNAAQQAVWFLSVVSEKIKSKKFSVTKFN